MSSLLPNVVCLVIDRLHAGMLGPYGNTWIQTEHFNRLAADALVFDQALTDHTDLSKIYRSYWLGRHALAPATEAEVNSALPVLLRAGGFRTHLLTDDAAVAQHPLAAAFDDCQWYDFPRQRGEQELADTRCAHFFASVTDALSELATEQTAADESSAAAHPFLAWLHTGHLNVIWDAPLELRNQYADGDEELPPKTSVVPAEILPADFDPDRLLGISHAYAGQVSLLDLCLEPLLELFEPGGALASGVLLVIGARGFPLGEHLSVGAAGNALHGELLHVPWLLRLPASRGVAIRTQSLVQPADIFATVADLCGVLLPTPAALHGQSLLPLAADERQIVRDRAVASNDHGERAIRTADWFLRVSPESQELYLKPDDRFELNEIGSRCEEIADGLKAVLADFLHAVAMPDEAAQTLAPLPEVLKNLPG